VRTAVPFLIRGGVGRGAFSIFVNRSFIASNNALARPVVGRRQASRTFAKIAAHRLARSGLRRYLSGCSYKVLLKFFKTKTGIRWAERVQSYGKITPPVLSNGEE
jgi:hypothetical protein